MSLFASPQIFWLFAIFLLPLCLFLFWTWRTKQKLIAQFVQSRLLANLTVGVSQTRQKLRLALVVASVSFLILAMARPQWGFSWEEARQQGLDIVVAIDTSRSMLAADLAPNRLTRAKLAALDLMRLAKHDRLGLVAFAGSAFLQCPLTLDEEAFRQSVEALDVGIIPQGGTALTEAIDTALTAFEKENDNHKVLVLFTDGEDHDSGVEAAAEKAEKAGMKIFTIGVGTAQGELIRVPDDQGGTSFLKDESGNAVKSRLDETLLRKIAVNGFYLPLQGAKAMDTLYAQGLAPLPKSDSTTKLVRQYRERFHWPLGVAILLLVLELFLPHRKRVNRIATNGGTADKAEVTAIVIAAIFLGISALPIQASPSSALRDYESGNYQSALEEFRKLSREKTNDLRLSYNAGTAAYRAKEYEAAEKLLGAAAAAPDLQLQQQAYYNLGNTLFEAGAQVPDPEKKKASWENSIQNFQNALKLNSADPDAKHNLALVQKKLEELKQQQQEQQKQDSKDDSSKDKDQQDKKDQPKDKDSKDQKDDKQSEKKDQKDDPDQKQKDEQKKKDAQEKAKEEKNKEEEDRQNGRENDQASEQEKQDAMAMAAGKMTQEQAKQFLDAQKQEDKPLIFAPAKKEQRPDRSFKDW